MNFAATKVPKARKPHNCDECGRIIETGETYHRTAGSWEGDFFTNIACAHCAAFRKHVDEADDCYSEGYYGGLHEWVLNGYYSTSDLPGLSFGRRLALYRMSRHMRSRWRDKRGELVPVPEETKEAVPTGAASVIQEDIQ